MDIFSIIINCLLVIGLFSCLGRIEVILKAIMAKPILGPAEDADYSQALSQIVSNQIAIANLLERQPNGNIDGKTTKYLDCIIDNQTSLLRLLNDIDRRLEIIESKYSRK